MFSLNLSNRYAISMLVQCTRTSRSLTCCMNKYNVLCRWAWGLLCGMYECFVACMSVLWNVRVLCGWCCHVCCSSCQAIWPRRWARLPFTTPDPVCDAFQNPFRFVSCFSDVVHRSLTLGLNVHAVSCLLVAAAVSGSLCTCTFSYECVQLCPVLRLTLSLTIIYFLRCSIFRCLQRKVH